MTAAWRIAPFSEAVADESSGNVKTPQSEFLSSGRYPVVDQGKQMIAGYVDDPSRICGAELPVVVFGDHTRCFKYVDFKFCMGADGVKILRPSGGANVKYLYYYLSSLRLPDGGYDRHFKYLKRCSVVLPPLEEQRRIAEVLDRAEALRAKRRAALALLDTLTQSIFLDLFGDPVRNEMQWASQRFADVAIFENGDRSGNYPSGDEIKNEGILFLSTKNIVNDVLDLENAAYITPEKFRSLSRGKARRGDLIITLRGTLGSCCVFDSQHETAFINAQMMIVRSKEASPRYLHALLTSKPARDRFSRIASGVAVPQLTAAHLAELPIPIPPIGLQHEFARRNTAVENLKSAHRASLAQLDALFASLQHRAFRGEL